MTSSLSIKKKREIDKYDDFSNDIDYNSKTDVFRAVLSLIVNQCELRRPKVASGHIVKCPPAAHRKQASEARLLVLKI